MSVPVAIDPEKREVKPGTLVELFALGAQLYGGGTALPFYAVSSDGLRFLTITQTRPSVTRPITVLQNWKRPAS